MMNIQYCSDLHLEFPLNKLHLGSQPLLPRGEILLLAGDIVPFYLIRKHDDFFDFLSEHFEVTYWVPGNHEYYGFDLANRCGSFQEKIRNNVYLVNNIAIDHAGYHFIFSTLWAKIHQADEWIIRQSIRDFQRIRYQAGYFHPAHFNEQHRISLEFLTAQFALNIEKKIVVTHHVPTFLHYPEKYQGDIFNQAFGVELHDVIQTCGVEHWIYGHHHVNIPAFRIGNTELLTNQFGYKELGEHTLFDPGKII